MNLKILFVLLSYYSLLSLILLLGAPIFLDAGVTSTIALNDSALQDGEIEQGGFFSTGVSFGRFFTLMTFGVGLPDTLPSWFIISFVLWQSLILVLTAGFIISSIWNG